jgi:hypothetical protein
METAPDVSEELAAIAEEATSELSAVSVPASEEEEAPAQL